LSSEASSRRRVLWVLPPIALGIAVLIWAAGGKQPPARAELGEPTRVVRVIEVPEIDLVPYAEGYGAVQPARVWRAVAQVEGRVVHVHPRLRNGEILSLGTLLFRIDPVDYELDVAQARAELAALDVQQANARSSLEIEKRNLSLAERELKRYQRLSKQGTTSQSAVDEAERRLLNIRAAIQNLQNTLALVPVQKRLLDAKVAQAVRDLENTQVAAPFNMRVANLQMEAEQYVSKGERLFEGDAVDRVEIVAQVALGSLRRLFIGRKLPVGDMNLLHETLSEIIAIRPLVRLDLGDHVAEWEAQFVRFNDDVDADTRTLGVVVAVDRPFEKVKPGYRPPLSKGMFVQVTLRGHAQPGRVVVPRSAVRGGVVYLADADNRLRRRVVRVLFDQDWVSVIESGVKPGDRVVVSDLVPAVDGMLLQPQVDIELGAELVAAARDDS